MSAFVDLYAALWAATVERYARGADSPGQLRLFGDDQPAASDPEPVAEPEPPAPEPERKTTGVERMLAAGIPEDLHGLARDAVLYGPWWVDELRPASVWLNEIAPKERSVSRFLRKRGFASPQEFYDKAAAAINPPKPKPSVPVAPRPEQPKAPAVVVQPTATKGVFSVHRKDGEMPFAMLHSPAARGSRAWGVEYRSQGDQPFDGQHFSTHHPTQNDAIQELERAARTGSDWQLGLSNIPPSRSPQ